MQQQILSVKKSSCKVSFNTVNTAGVKKIVKASLLT